MNLEQVLIQGTVDGKEGTLRMEQKHHIPTCRRLAIRPLTLLGAVVE